MLVASRRLLLLTLPELSGQEHNLRNFRRVVLYKRDRKCPICDLKVHQAVPDWESDICEHAWRYIHGFSQTIKCGLYYYMKFTNYQSLRDEQRKLLNKNSINTISDTNNSLIGTNITTSSDNSTENLEKSTDI
ncbi:hypothetical protein BMR1_03g02045 [Babesia microti strain RI]|uniref:Uncharacterized protein n=1 Tax=Babesia microti (strain RI) TaxID=1133968 RepID=A0A0K3AQV7_BABMR|nr:hypothetical protein BMR1_03g02045 [Babesia microti strain RI]CTQ41008.1 hypothetical protein BMR1_03g02045 [Babesia microti strain RI]|eukprot:XP_012649019.1 hypothetical protein BMR1_03g02045 [Babesia microti strain RI]